jgi:hypothetical protein
MGANLSPSTERGERTRLITRSPSLQRLIV